MCQSRSILRGPLPSELQQNCIETRACNEDSGQAITISGVCLAVAVLNEVSMYGVQLLYQGEGFCPCPVLFFPHPPTPEGKGRLSVARFGAPGGRRPTSGHNPLLSPTQSRGTEVGEKLAKKAWHENNDMSCCL